MSCAVAVSNIDPFIISDYMGLDGFIVSQGINVQCNDAFKLGLEHTQTDSTDKRNFNS